MLHASISHLRSDNLQIKRDLKQRTNTELFFKETKKLILQPNQIKQGNIDGNLL